MAAVVLRHLHSGGDALMFKSKEAKAWEQKVQHLIDLIIVHNDEAAKLHAADEHRREERHALQCARLMGQLARLTDDVPAGAKLPKLPKIK